ncbi:MAG: DUF1636 domain-containing protein [Microcoleus sp. SIO2G3]|nr:DUF1636 domain-containing protein [Microcoleus sp. SIO2G3]
MPFQHLAQDWNLQNQFQIQAVECMIACNRSRVIAFVSALSSNQ